MHEWQRELDKFVKSQPPGTKVLYIPRWWGKREFYEWVNTNSRLTKPQTGPGGASCEEKPS